jgi:hypothetical protein
VQGNGQRPYPTFDLALTVLPQPHWSALTPSAPLRRWRLIEIGAGQTLTQSPLRIDEWVLHILTGATCSDERTLDLFQMLSIEPDLVPSHYHLATQLADIWRSPDSQVPLRAQLRGTEIASKPAIATAVCRQLGWPLYRFSVRVLPTQPQDLQTLITLWNRTAALYRAVLFIDCEGMNLEASPREDGLMRLLAQIPHPLILGCRDRWPSGSQAFIHLEVQSPTPDEQQTLWRQALGETAEALNGQVEQLAHQFQLNGPMIRAVWAEVVGQLSKPEISVQSTATPQECDRLGQLLRHTCRVHTRPQLDDLAQRIEAIATWEDLVLPERETTILKTIAAHVHHRVQVYDRWGFRTKGDRGLGISALFAGVSGTGKTMSAEVLAAALQLDLYRIDLSSVVSKYIGETEKNLRRIFDAAEASTVILLFDEADALFGKRSEVKDSHDRYANMEVSYLLQRMEAYQGLAILTTNLKDSLDSAFLRRLRFVIKFPFPDARQREEIWQKVFPPQTPTQDLDLRKLAKLNVSGGNIRNIALNATFLAASQDEPVQMKHLKAAAYSEYLKLERPLTDAEVKGWVPLSDG